MSCILPSDTIIGNVCKSSSPIQGKQICARNIYYLLISTIYARNRSKCFAEEIVSREERADSKSQESQKGDSNGAICHIWEGIIPPVDNPVTNSGCC